MHLPCHLLHSQHIPIPPFGLVNPVGQEDEPLPREHLVVKEE